MYYAVRCILLRETSVVINKSNKDDRLDVLRLDADEPIKIPVYGIGQCFTPVKFFLTVFSRQFGVATGKVHNMGNIMLLVKRVDKVSVGTCCVNSYILRTMRLGLQLDCRVLDKLVALYG